MSYIYIIELVIGSNVDINENFIINSWFTMLHNSIIGKSSHHGTQGATISGNIHHGERVLVGVCAIIYISYPI